jgi:2-dehydropantoate 2-reductase
MKILVYGAGAVGGYVGACLANAGHDLTLVLRGDATRVIEAKGLTVQAGEDRFTVRPAVRTSLAHTFQEQGVQFDLVVLGMKAYDLKTAVDHLVAFCPNPPPLLTLQNGIGVERPFIEQFGAERVIVGALTTPVSKATDDQIVVERTDRGLGLAPARAGDSVSRWANMLQKAGVETAVCPDYNAMKWSKAFLNIVANATSAILNRPPGVIYQSDAIFDLEVRMLRETLAVMDALKLDMIDLPGSPAKKLAFGVRHTPRFLLKPILSKQVSKGRGEKMPSFQLDLVSGKGQSEVIFHNGAIAKAALAHKIPAPINTALTDILLRLTRQELDWREFDGKPARLLAEVARFDK